MTEAVEVGAVSEIWRFPVKSMLGERLDHAEIGERGIERDRGWALQDAENGKIVSAVEFRRYTNLFAFRARTIDSADGGDEAGVSITLPDGREVLSSDAECDHMLSQHLGRRVKLVESGATGSGPGRSTGPFHDASPLSVLSHSTLARMNTLQPESRFDSRRFRMNLVLKCDEEGFPENNWVGRHLTFGSGLEIRVTRPDARCVMTTLAQEDLPEDREILKGLARHNRLAVGDKGRYPCAGVYASVVASGPVQVGDAVSLG